MSINANVSFKDVAPAENTTTGNGIAYNLRGQSLTSSERVMTTSTAAAGQILRISHRKEKLAGQSVDAHLMQIVRTERDANNVPFEASISIAIKVPNNGPIDATEVGKMYANILNLATCTGVYDAVMRGES